MQYLTSITTVNMEMINMKKIFFLMYIALVSLSVQAGLDSKQKEEILSQLSKERYFPYQDIIINNEIISKGVGPDCSLRYDAISKVLSKYQGPIKVLDIGASNGYFSLRIAHDYNALCVMADVSDRLCKICELNDQIPNIIYLKKALSLNDLSDLCQNEHFDVVLALNVVHHMEPWKEILDVIFKLGDTVIIETPPSNDDRVKDTPSIPLIEDYLLNKSGGKVIAQIPRAAANNFDQIVVLDGKTDFLKQKEYTPNAYAKMFCFENIKSSFDKPTFKLSTFYLLNGVFPAINYFDEQQNQITLQ